MQNNPALGLLLTIGFIQMWMMPAIAWALLKDHRDVAARFWFTGTACYAGAASLFVLGRFISSDMTAMFGFILVAGMLACFGLDSRSSLIMLFEIALLLEIVTWSPKGTCESSLRLGPSNEKGPFPSKSQSGSLNFAG